LLAFLFSATSVTSLESTSVEPPANVDSKALTENLTPLDAAVTKNRGGGWQLIA
jgi:hypothetical protein